MRERARVSSDALTFKATQIKRFAGEVIMMLFKIIGENCLLHLGSNCSPRRSFWIYLHMVVHWEEVSGICVQPVSAVLRHEESRLHNNQPHRNIRHLTGTKSFN